MAEQIPINTLCIIVGDRTKKEHLGAYCTVVGYVDPSNILVRYDDEYWIIFADKRTNPVTGEQWSAGRHDLHPLYPPKQQDTTRKDKDVPVTV